MRLNIIAAVAANNAIGYQNKLLYHIKADMQRFRQLTTGHTVIMGGRLSSRCQVVAYPTDET